MSRPGSRSRPAGWAPSHRELKKYASLFLQTDGDKDGYVAAGEAKILCDRSGLDEDSLYQAWNLSDQDGDGYLSFKEFVTLVHLISCFSRGMLRGAPPSTLPRPLSEALAAIRESPEELAMQRSRSTTPATSRATSRASSESPAPRAPPTETFPTRGAGVHQPAGFDARGSATPHLPVADARSSAVSQPSWGAGVHQPDYAKSSATPQQPVADARSLAVPQSSGMEARGMGVPLPSGLDALMAQGPPPAPSVRPRSRDKMSKLKQPEPKQFDPEDSSSVESSPRFGDSSRPEPDRFNFDPVAIGAASKTQVAALKTHFGALLEADRILLRQAQRAADDIEDDLQRTRDFVTQLQFNLRREREESSYRVEAQKQLERQVAQAKSRLAEMRKMRAAMNVDSVSFWTDRERFTQEHTFMEDTFHEEDTLLKKLKTANDILKMSHEAHTEQTRQLEKHRKEVVDLVQQEIGALQRDEQTTEEVRAALQRLKRGQGDARPPVKALSRPPGDEFGSVDALRGPPAPAFETVDALRRPSAPDFEPANRLRFVTDQTDASSCKSEVWEDGTAGEQLRREAELRSTRSTPVSATRGDFSAARSRATTGAAQSTRSSPKSEIWRDETADGQVGRFHTRSRATTAAQSSPKSEIWRDETALGGEARSSWASSLVGSTFGLPAARGSFAPDPRDRDRPGV